MKYIDLILISVLSVACTSVASVPQASAASPEGTHASVPDHPEARLYDKDADSRMDVDVALADAMTAGKHAIIVMGTNRCHDSRALAGWFETPRFQTLLNENYVLRYVDVGQKNRNIDIAQSFGLDSIVGTPTVVITNSDGDVINLDTAPTWRNAASRSESEIYSYFEGFALKSTE